MIGAGLARVAATTLEIAEAVMESYDPEAARGNRNRRGKASRKGRTKTARTKIAPGPVCESIDDASSDGGGSSSDDDDAFLGAQAVAAGAGTDLGQPRELEAAASSMCVFAVAALIYFCVPIGVS